MSDSNGPQPAAWTLNQPLPLPAREDSGSDGAAGALLSFRDVRVARAGMTNLHIGELDLRRGEIHALVGPNGSGKTTLVEVAAGLLAPTGGSVSLLGMPLWPPGRRFREVRRRATLIMTEPHMFRGTVARNLAFALKGARVPRAERRERMRHALAQVGLEGFEERAATRLSSGEKKRVAIARAICYAPDLYLFDEPTRSVDRDSVPRILKLMRRIRQDLGREVVFTTHQLDIAYQCADNIVSLMEGSPAPHVPENLFSGKATPKGETTEIAVDGDMTIIAAGSFSGPVRTTVDPRQIVLSEKPLDSSALNCVRATVTGLSHEGPIVRVRLDGGLPLAAVITPRSCEKLALALGTRVYATFKSAAVRVYC